MRRPPNISLTQWLQQNAALSRMWVTRAVCGQRHDLPWIADSRPTIADENEMRRVCSTCPVLLECANYALRAHGKRGVEGGFYAGVWLPWPYSNESLETHQSRNTARLMLRRLMRAGTPA